MGRKETVYENSQSGNRLRAVGDDNHVVALFVESLPADVFDQLMSTTLLIFEISLLTDPEFVDIARERLRE